MKLAVDTAPSQTTCTLRLNCWTSRKMADESSSTSASGSVCSSCLVPTVSVAPCMAV
eukprot:CAMPEP_0181184416 /NCGR_PEP_ID=MMETSP1096-20121128/8955_1 /TAXON_ID=156174 ORGANISM="Chrysochromulina ericina, Strain CCMP281" /NCGR_SAMPLE_ID=MMETSP1096 /ASSEMBLY_ACC=CAM_ASM_000453 /LENGTH=56 /DNA_ID=CAMNT_0023273177 /DNA_START=681 /DNA_END=851 /DNA_ORIENTATION=-